MNYFHIIENHCERLCSTLYVYFIFNLYFTSHVQLRYSLTCEKSSNDSVMSVILLGLHFCFSRKNTVKLVFKLTWKKLKYFAIKSAWKYKIVINVNVISECIFLQNFNPTPLHLKFNISNLQIVMCILLWGHLAKFNAFYM